MNNDELSPDEQAALEAIKADPAHALLLLAKLAEVAAACGARAGLNVSDLLSLMSGGSSGAPVSPALDSLIRDRIGVAYASEWRSRWRPNLQTD